MYSIIEVCILLYAFDHGHAKADLSECGALSHDVRSSWQDWATSTASGRVMRQASSTRRIQRELPKLRALAAIFRVTLANYAQVEAIEASQAEQYCKLAVRHRKFPDNSLLLGKAKCSLLLPM